MTNSQPEGDQPLAAIGDRQRAVEEWVNAAARVIDQGAWQDLDNLSPTEREMWERSKPERQHLAKTKARALLDLPLPVADLERELTAVNQHLDACYEAAKVPKSSDQPLSHFIAQMKRQLEELTSPALPVASAWQGIETAPRDGTQVLLYFPKRYQGKGGISWGCFIGGEWLDSRAYRDPDATHWQPLPAPPGTSSPLPVEGERERMIEECAKIAEKRAGYVSCDPTFERGYYAGREYAAKEIRALSRKAST